MIDYILNFIARHFFQGYDPGKCPDTIPAAWVSDREAR